MLACAALAMLLLHRTRVGHHLYAVGGDITVARTSGIRVDVPVITAHVICSVLAGMAGLLLASRLGVGSPTVGSQGGYDLLSIAAVVLGGTLLAGGKGTITGTLGGVLIFAMLDNIMSVMQINPFLKDVVRGVVIVVAVAVYARRRIVSRPERFAQGSHGSARCPGRTRGGTMSTALTSGRSAILKQNRASRPDRLLRAVRTPAAPSSFC